MRETVLLVLAAASSYAGFACLALAQERHWTHVTARPGPTPRLRQRLRGMGVLGLGVSLLLALWRDGPGLGSLLWSVLLTATALGVALTLTWQPRWLRWGSDSAPSRPGSNV